MEMSPWFKLPHPFPQIAEELAFDNDEMAERWLQLAAGVGLTHILLNVQDYLPARRAERAAKLLDELYEYYKCDAAYIRKLWKTIRDSDYVPF